MRFDRECLSGKGTGGYFLTTGVLVALLLMLILTPLLIQMNKENVVGAVKENKKTKAFHLAEGAVERGYWKVMESASTWDLAGTSGGIPGYRYGTTHTDAGGGSYQINITSVSGVSGALAIEATGKVDGEYRAVRAVYRQPASSGAVGGNVSAAFDLGNTASLGIDDMRVYWGPIIYRNPGKITLEESLNQLYPRKFFSGGFRTENPTSASREDWNIGVAAQGPDTVGGHLDYWTYYPNPPAPVPDFDYYKAKAISQHPSSIFPAHPQYFPVDWTIPSSGFVDTECTINGEDKVYYVEDELVIGADGGDNYFCGIVIVRGEMLINNTEADHLSNGTVASSLTVVPPANAWKEYSVNVPVHENAREDLTYDRVGLIHSTGTVASCPCKPPHGDSSSLHEYPGDEGYHVTADSTFPYSFTTGCTNPAHASDPVKLGKKYLHNDPLFFKGFWYVGGGLSVSVGSHISIYGALQVVDSISFFGGSRMEIFFDDRLNIKYQGMPMPGSGESGSSSITRISWYEVKPHKY